MQHLGRDTMMIDADLLARHGRSARTQVKKGALRQRLMGVAAGGDLPPHSTDNPVSIQVLDGEVTFYALDEQYSLGAGDVLILGARVEHAARSMCGATFLLTVAYTAPAGDTAAVVQEATMDHPLAESARKGWLDEG